ncbi:MAG: hypothetical protein C4582_11890 [Desulfobacteraceae bacterium]|jgi:heterodisulfide reductase subunit C|nr:MAG: hypothetical protein C4582_11890 [Desulfobacteraceae bacterium]
MFFNVLLYGSLLVFFVGLAYKLITWFSLQIAASQKDFKTGQRVVQCIKGILGAVFSTRILSLLKAFVADILVQRRILKEDSLRWAMHMLIFWGFMLLLLMHGLEKWISEPLFSGYASTANPFFFLRDIFALMVLAGVGLALYRRFVLKVPRLRTKAADHYAIWILAVIMFSGILLEGAKILSHREFMRMVQDYADTDDPDEVKALESYWVEAMGLSSQRVHPPFSPETLKKGMEIHEMSCQSCHASSAWAFTGYAASAIMRPLAKKLEQAGTVDILWTIHILACFLGLAYLPFSKMFHIIASPISLLVNSVMDQEKSHPANLVTRQVMELDACTRCGTCSLRCSAAPASQSRGNTLILPSEKLQFLRKITAGKKLSEMELKVLREGVYLCTSCERCTVVCPSGINLKALWSNVREDLIEREPQGEALMLSTFSFARGLDRSGPGDVQEDKPLKDAWRTVIEKWQPTEQGSVVTLPAGPVSEGILSRDSGTFASCFGCQNCTTVCPVVGMYEDPESKLGLLPHQIMASLSMGLGDLACSAGMLWSCVTCYQCQEHCPQMVEVADILFELKNIAIRGPERSPSSFSGMNQSDRLT